MLMVYYKLLNLGSNGDIYVAFISKRNRQRRNVAGVKVEKTEHSESWKSGSWNNAQMGKTEVTHLYSHNKSL